MHHSRAPVIRTSPSSPHRLSRRHLEQLRKAYGGGDRDRYLTETIQSRNYSCGPGSSVGIATDYELDDPGSNPGVDKIFHPSGTTLGPTQPPVQWVPSLSRG